MKQIYEREGMYEFFDALQAGSSEDDYFRMLTEKLGVDKNGFSNYVKAGMQKLEVLSKRGIMQLKY